MLKYIEKNIMMIKIDGEYFYIYLYFYKKY